jgi:broad specificity phosphatase PhoE
MRNSPIAGAVTETPRDAVGSLHLVRHGHSAFVHDGRWMNPDDVARFDREYDARGIRDDSLPPPALIETAAQAAVIAASDLPRAIASARRLAPGREPDVSPLLREIELETSPWMPRVARLPVVAWDAINFARWSYRLLTQSDHAFVRRADAAVDWLLERMNGDSTVLVITHGGFRRLLDARLIARGWLRVPGPLSYANWSSWSYRATRASRSY